jgi:RNA polymerase sigma-70 factor (ECF subfamily)
VTDRQRQDALYAEAAAFAPAIERLAHAVEAHPERARDLAQDIHLALWRSFARFDGGCALSTWAYRVAHNVAASHARSGARAPRLVTLDEAETAIAHDDPADPADPNRTPARLTALRRRLAPPDRQLILLYLEGLDTAAIAAVTGHRPGAVSVKVHRIKALLAKRFHLGDPA